VELEKAIRERRSIRSFKEKKLSKNTIKELIKTATQAPSAGNLQLWKFVVLEKTKTKKELIKKAGSSPLIERAPISLAVFYGKNNYTERRADYMSAAAAIQNLMLAAYSKRIGSLWIGHIGDSKKAGKIMGMSEDFELVAYVLLGYSDQKPEAPPRRSMGEVLRFETEKPERSLPAAGISPKKWDPKKLLSQRDHIIRQTTPERESFPFGSAEEFKTEMHLLEKSIGKSKNVLEILGFAGTHSFYLLERKKIKLEIFEVSQNAVYFMKNREKFFKLKSKPQYILSKNKKIPLKAKSVKCAFCAQKLETIPELSMIKEVSRILKKGGIFALSFRNMSGWYGLNYRKKSRQGYPYEPLNYFEVKKKLADNDFEIKEEYGISPLPFLRGKIVGAPATILSKIVLLKCKKK